MRFVYDAAAAAGFLNQIHPGKFGQHPAAGDIADAESGGNLIRGLKPVSGGAGFVFNLLRQFFSYFFPQTAYFLNGHYIFSLTVYPD